MALNRIIGEREGQLHGTLFVIFGQMHGNEPAGSIAAELLFAAIDKEYENNPKFMFRGKIVAMRGNTRAAAIKARYIDRDLNRFWSPENVAHAENSTADGLYSEDLEMREIVAEIRRYISEYKPTDVVVLDLHTTTAHGGIFSIPAQNETSRTLALGMYAPVIHGFIKNLGGTSLHYFKTENFGIRTTAVCFESGQHDSPESPKLALSAIINCFRALGGFADSDVEMRHDILLQERAQHLPREARLVYTHSIAPEDEFRMRNDHIFQNFDPIEKGEIIAYDKNGAVLAPMSGLILMPLYQKLGSDGFFIVQEIETKLHFKEWKPAEKGLLV